MKSKLISLLLAILLGTNLTFATSDSFVFVSNQNGSTVGLVSLSSHQTLEYSTDGDLWNPMTTATTITLNNGVSLYVRGKLTGNNSGLDDHTQFSITGSVEARGNINYLWDYENLNAPLKQFCGYLLFQECAGLTSAPELPSTTLAYSCYHAMFLKCTNLTTAPELPAMECAPSCYRAMFQDCTSLTTAPDLPATTLANNCYKDMFVNCSNLVNIPSELPALSLDSSCYRAMFYACTSLTNMPMLSATNLAPNCYFQMFKWCENLQTASVLPASTLANDCYYDMFAYCSSLTTAPELPAEQMKDGCYRCMFLGCTSLSTAPALPATQIADNCYRGMFQECSALTTAPVVLPALTLADSCYRSMFYECTSLVEAPVLPAKTLTAQCYYSMFTGCNKLNYIKCLATSIGASECTQNWVSGVSSTGEFTRPTNMSAWSSGNDGTPAAWTTTENSPYVVQFDANGGLLGTQTFRNTPSYHATGLDAGHATGYVVVNSGTSNFRSIGSNWPQREGHTFLGWFTAKSGGTEVYDNTGTCVTGDYWDSDNKWIGTADLQLYAHWSVNNYTITWLNDDDSQIDQTIVEYGVVPTHANPTKEATAEYTYTFAGWTPDVVAVTGDATYKATFESHALQPAANPNTTAENSIPVRKILRDNQVLILRGDKTYTLTGQEVK